MKISTILRNILIWIGSLLLPLLLWLPEVLKKLPLSGWTIVSALLGMTIATVILMTAVKKRRIIILPMIGLSSLTAIALVLAHFLNNYSVPSIFFKIYYTIIIVAIIISMPIVLVPHLKKRLSRSVDD